MEINVFEQMSGYDLPKEDLLIYLSQVVLAKTDEEIETANNDLIRSKEHLNESKVALKSVKVRLFNLMGDYERYRVMKEVLKKIDTLRKEGVIVGQNKVKINNILMTIEDQPLRTLKSLEDRLSAYVPETPKITYG